MKIQRLRLLALSLFTTLVLLGSSLPTQNVRAQQRKFTPGEMVETGGGITAKILQCRGAGDSEECEVQYYRGDVLESTPRWENTLFLRNAEERILSNKKRQEAEQAAPNVNEPTRPVPAPVANKEMGAAQPAVAECTFTVPPGDTSKTAKASEQLFKHKVYDIYHILANGTGSAPLKVGVTFLSFQVSKPFTNIVRVDPGRGAYRVNDAAPANATIYPVKSEHIVCEQYRDRTTRRRVANKYACFKNRDGEWQCGADGIPTIIQLN